jgi:hypothetical protein
MVAPDRAQQPVRERALSDGKLLCMPVPKLAEDPRFTPSNPLPLPSRPPKPPPEKSPPA